MCRKQVEVGGYKLSGALLDTERAPSNIIWILFDYILFISNKKGTFHPFQNVGGVYAPSSYIPVGDIVYFHSTIKCTEVTIISQFSWYNYYMEYSANFHYLHIC